MATNDKVEENHKLYVACGLCDDLILEDWLKQNKAQLTFKPPMLSVSWVEESLWGSEEKVVPNLAKDGIKILAWTVVISKGVVNSEREFSSGTYQVTPVEEKSDEKGIIVWIICRGR